MTIEPAVSTSIVPTLSVRHGTRALEFYKAAPGAVVVFKIEAEGSVVARPALDMAESLGGGTVRMVLTVADPDALFDRAVAAGGSVVWPVADQPYGWRVGRMLDPFGHHWKIGKPLG